MSKTTLKHILNDLLRQDDEPVPNYSARSISRIEGVYGVQAIATGNHVPDIGGYRQSIQEAEEWVCHAAEAGRHDHFLLDEGRSWRIYDRTGEQIAKLRKLPGRPRQERKNPAHIARALLEKDAMIATGLSDLVCLAVFEAHTGLACADQANFATVTERLVNAANEEDLDRIHLVESNRWPCRVSGLFAQFQNLSQKAKNEFLDCYPLLSCSQPIDSYSHLNLLARRLARFEFKNIAERLRQIFEGERFEDDYGNEFIDGDYFVGQFLSAPPRKRQSFIRFLLELAGHETEHGSPERLNLDRIKYSAELAIHGGMHHLDLLQK